MREHIPFRRSAIGRAVIAFPLTAALGGCAAFGGADPLGEDEQGSSRLKYRSGPVCSCGGGTTEESIRRAEEAREAEQETAR